MKTQLQKLNLLAKISGLSLVLSLFAINVSASDNKANAADSGSSKYTILKSEVSYTAEKNQSKFEKEVNAITNRISEAVKFRATPLDFDTTVTEMDSELNTITEEVAKSVKFQPNVNL
jgi:hypothetical protein